MNHPEYDDQVAVFNWAEVMVGEFPDLKLLNGSLNGVRVTPGQAKKLKAAGMRKGFPDINLPVPRGIFHGLYIELKPLTHGVKRKRRPRPTKEQDWWLTQLNLRGYDTYVCYGREATITTIMSYLNEKEAL